MCYMIDPRSDDNYGLSDDAELAYSWQWSDIVWFLLFLLCVLFILPLLPLLLLVAYALSKPFSMIWGKISHVKRSHLALILALIMVVEALACVFLYRQILPLMPPKPQPISTAMPRRGAAPLVTTAPSRPPRPSSTSTPVPTSTPAAPLQAPLTPFAAYAPPSSETPVAVERDTRLAACEGKPLYLWKSPSGYGDGSGKSAPGSESSAVSVLECPDMRGAWMYGMQSFGAQLSEPPIPGVGARRSCGGRETLISVIGFD
jgi:hypothetical protein